MGCHLKPDGYTTKGQLTIYRMIFIYFLTTEQTNQPNDYTNSPKKMRSIFSIQEVNTISICI